MSENTVTLEIDTRKPVYIPLDVVQRTDVGRVRSENQDFAIATTDEESAAHGYLLIVADGMGGHRGGATASRMAGNIVRDDFLTSQEATEADILRSALLKANALIFSESESNTGLRGMGTTCSVMLVRGNLGWVAHIGDSRIYRIRDGEIEAMTQDHSLVATMVREGLITEEEAEVHPRRNVLQRSMGVVAEAEIDVYEPFEILEGDTFILCSDGLHGLVKGPELCEIGSGDDLDAMIDHLVNLALERGAPDNVTVIVARAGAPATSPIAAKTRSSSKRSVDTPDSGAVPLLGWLFVALLALAATGALVLSINEGSILDHFQKKIEGR